MDQTNKLKNKQNKEIYFIADTCFDLNILPAYKFFYLKLF